MEWYVILVIVVFLIIVFVLDLKIVYYYEHPDDSSYNQGLIAKVTAIIGFELIWLLLTVVPTDAFNAFVDAGLNMGIFWKMVLLVNMLYLFFPVPFATSFFEADTDPRTTKTPAWLRALKLSAIVCTCCASIMAVMYFVFRNTKQKSCNELGHCELVDAKTPFFVFSAISIGFFGWILLVIYLGVGLVAVPQGLIVGFINRPKPITQQEYSEAKEKIAEQIVALKAVGEELRDRQNKLRSMSAGISKWNTQRVLRSELNKFRQSVHLLEEEFASLNTAFKLRGENPFFSYVKLAAGIISVALSLIWYLHFILYILLPQMLQGTIIWGFLDSLFEAIAKVKFYVFDLVLYMFFIGYLMVCQMIGCFRFNMRMFCCFSIHPMKKNDTHLNSILFNTSLTLVSAHAIAHLSYISFRQYCSGSYAELLYGEWAANTPVFGSFYKNNIFIWILVLWVLVCMIFFAVKPNDQIEFSLDRIKKMKFASKSPKGAKGAKEGETSPAEEKKGEETFFSGVDKEAEKKVGQIDRTLKFLI